MNSTFIDHINSDLTKLFDNYPGSKLYGLAQSVVRRKGDAFELLPATVDKYGEGKWVGLDTTVPIQLYHKAVTLNTVVTTGSGYGDDLGEYQNTYGNTMIVYLNRTKTKLLPDELYLYLQANFPERLSVPDMNRVTIRITSVILNTQTVVNAEYQNTAILLGPEHNLFAVNYTIESVFNKNCFEKCPTC